MKYFKTFEKYRYGVNGVGSLRNSLAALKRQNINGRYVDPEILAQGIRNEYEAITGEKYEDEVQMSMDNTIADIIGHFKLDGPDFMAAWDKVVKESVNEASDQQRLTHLRKFGIAPNNQPQNAAYIKQVSKPGKFFVDWKDAFKLGDVALEFIKSVGSISEFDIIDLKTMKRTGKQLDVKKGQLGNLRTTYGVRVNEGTYNSKNHIGSTSDGQGSNAEIYKKGKGYYVVVSGEADYDFEAKNDKELINKLEEYEFDSSDILESVNEATDMNESYKGNFTDFKYDLEMAIDNMDISPKAIKSVKKKGKGYEVRLSSYMSDKSTWEKIGDTIGATLISFKPGSINIGIYE